MVAMAIIAIVATMCASAFMMVIGAEMRETNTRLASEKAEERIAAGDEPTTKMAVDLPLGDYTIPWTTAETYEEAAGEGDQIATENGQIDVSGDRSYTVIKGVEPEKLVFVVSVGAGDLSFIIPTSGFAADNTSGSYNASYDWTIDWGDDNGMQRVAPGISNAGNASPGIRHDYTSAGKYAITIWPGDGKSDYQWARAFGFFSDNTLSSLSTNKAKVTSVIEMPTKGFLQSATKTGHHYLHNTWYGCTNLIRATVPDTSGLKITDLGSDFLNSTWSNCSSLIEAAVPDTSAWQPAVIPGYFLYFTWSKCDSLVTAAVPDTSAWNPTTLDGYFMTNTWERCASLTIAIVPDTSRWNINTIGGFFMAYTWYACKSITVAVVPDTSAWRPTVIENSFFYYTWGGCGLVTADVPDTSNWKITIIKNSFLQNAWSFCDQLITAEVPDTSNWEVTSIGSEFLYYTWYNCARLTAAAIPNTKEWHITGTSPVGKNFLSVTWGYCPNIKDLTDIKLCNGFKDVSNLNTNTGNWSNTFYIAYEVTGTTGQPPSFYDGTLITQGEAPPTPRQTFYNRTGMAGYSGLDPNWTTATP
jgi:hypothetical protein